MKANILLVCTFLVVLLFMYTATSKLLDMGRFAAELHNQPIPQTITPYLVWMIPSLEIIIAFLLIFEHTRLIGLCGSFMLMSVFTVYTALVLLRVFQRVPCSCGGVIRQLTWPGHLVFNICFVLISLIGIKLFMHEHRECRNPV